MKISEALTASDGTGITVETKAGSQYAVDQAVLIDRDRFDDDYVYGWRLNALPTNRFKRGRGAANGDVRWFHLKNVKLITD